jgi:methanogenic corrinoid protein MtbC1
MDTFIKIYEAILGGKYEEIDEYIKEALDESIPVHEIVDKALVKGMTEVGDKFGKGIIII